jgi:alkylation response protein AidB-like acyl-CoA dehydrogenase
MDLTYTAADLAFRDMVRGFLDTNLPSDLQKKVRNHLRLSRQDYVRWHQIVARQGWAAPAGRSSTAAPAGAPPSATSGKKSARAPARRPSCRSASTWWRRSSWRSATMRKSPLPAAHPQLRRLVVPGLFRAGLRLRPGLAENQAERDGDHYIVNGQKTWTTLAQHADMIFCLVRTDSSVRKQEGISFLLIDMKTPGITVRPIIMLDEDHEVNEVFFDNVRVPVQNLIGQENKGWTYAKYLLGHERTGIAVGRSKRELLFLKKIASEHYKHGKPLMQDPVFAAKVASLEIELMALETTVLRVLTRESQAPGPEASLLKIRGSEIQQQLTELMVEALGPDALPFDTDYLEGKADHAVTGDDAAAPLAGYYFNFRKTSIYGGSNEIQKTSSPR